MVSGMKKKLTKSEYGELAFYRKMAAEVTDEELLVFYEKHKDAKPMEVGRYACDSLGTCSRIAVVKREADFWVKAYIGYMRHFIHREEYAVLWKYRYGEIGEEPYHIWVNGNWLSQAPLGNDK